MHVASAMVGALALLTLAGCTTDPSVTAPTETTGSEESAEPSVEWFDQALFDKQDAERDVVPEGPDGQPYLQYINAEMTDTSQYKAEGAKKGCFANASISNPWRQTGWITMNEQLKALQESGAISELETRDAQDSDDTQIADID
ncbi:MAG TPA: ABC transporter substrate-binding protein, partial [Microterricola sp.]